MPNQHSTDRKPVTTRHDRDMVRRIHERALVEGRSVTEIADELWREYLDSPVAVPRRLATAREIELLGQSVDHLYLAVKSLSLREIEWYREYMSESNDFFWEFLGEYCDREVEHAAALNAEISDELEEDRAYGI